ncbi:MAG TPA: DUF4114 domain-containing protein [Polyangiaceae bacterium]|nr:DUF4114 domain-containing protein [Polyangiaceae bacterium]
MTIGDGRTARIGCALRGWLLGAALGSFALPAGAVMQTNGPVIPAEVNSTTCESHASVCINDNEVDEGGAGDIDAVMTATISQETFSPLCQLTFKVVARGASYQNTFGWYAVKRDDQGVASAPQLSDLHVFLGCGDAIGVEKTLSLPKDVGEIGFFLANDGNSCVPTQDDPVLGGILTEQPTNLFFSQREFNSDSGSGDNLIHLLVWQSRANPNAFYFGWEDLKGGGDNDFEDLMTYVTGIQCAGGGEPCQAEGEGVCGDGIMQCRDGALACVPTQTPSPEKCNGLDDDCNGKTDEGDGLCKQGEICVKGHCEPPCGTGEFRCDSGEVCVQGVCIEESCATKQCAAGSVCRDGKCVAPCDGVVCPYGAQCRRGLCVDVCEGIECDAGFVCDVRQSSDQETVVGVCTSCDCRGCGDGSSCVGHLCVEDACKDKTCGDGTHCVAGDCVDDCADAKCPHGQTCEFGRCVGDVTSGSGGAGNGDGDEGGDGSGAKDGSAGGLINPGGSLGGSSGAKGDTDNSGVADDKNHIEAKGCSCGVPGENGSGRAPLVLLGLLLGAAGLRSRRKR